MKMIVFLAMVISAAGYAGLAPGFAMILGMPLTLAVFALVTISMIYVLAKA